MHILGVLAENAARTMQLATPNFTTGFHAASVDLGRLQQALDRGVARFDATGLEDRWQDVLAWMRDVVRAWVQRFKRLTIERRDSGVHVELVTQDDHGYYSCAFDVFLSRTGGKTTRRR
jgi:hypothetical protein